MISLRGRAVAVEVDPGQVWRVGYRPTPWAWTPWRYATHGRFDGRWDDPAGEFRTVYAGHSLYGCLLEVLARFRPDLPTVAALEAVDEDPADAAEHPTVTAGVLDRAWLAPGSPRPRP